MAFLITCPNCGERDVHEFRFGGEITLRPSADATAEEWSRYLYVRRNVAGDQREWWYHAFGCRKWFVVVRDTETNEVRQTLWPEEARA